MNTIIKTKKEQNKIFFYIPKSQVPHDIPMMGSYDWLGFSQGKFTWVLQTYFRLKEMGYPCELVHAIPAKGIIVSHRGFLADNIIPNKNQLLVCLQADWGRHPFAQVHICQNKAQTLLSGVPRLERYFSPGDTYFVHHWLQSGQIPRDSSRKNHFLNLYYFGIELNLAKELKSDDWLSFLKNNGINWVVITEPNKWKDYSEADAVLFIRDFHGKKHINKPATKLYNTWNSGSVAICTPESAYLDEISDNNEVIIVSNYKELKKEIILLKENDDLFTNMLNTGKIKSKEYRTDLFVNEWIDIFEKIKNHKDGNFKYFSFIISRWMSFILCKLLAKFR